MRVGVTGAGGFVGSHVAEALLAAGHETVCMVRSRARARALQGLAVELVEADLASGAGVGAFARGLDAVIHVAGLTKAASPLDYWRVNVGGTRRLLEALRRHSPGLGRLVAVSSLAVHGPGEGAEAPITEDRPLHPLTPYARSKAAMEALLAREASGVPFVVLRPAPVYGPRDLDFLPVFRLAARGLGFGLSRRSLVSMVYVGDFARAALLALESPGARGRSLIVCDDRPLSHADIAALAGGGRRVAFLVPPPPLARAAVAVSEVLSRLSGRPPLLNAWKLRELSAPWWVASNGLAKSVLGWEPRAEAEGAFAATRDWYRSRGYL